MSVIKKTPFIHSVLASLDETLIEKLISAIDSPNSIVEASILPGSNLSNFADDVTTVKIKLTSDITVKGILIYNDAYCVLIGYGGTQCLTLTQINPTTKKFKAIHEHLTIEELRRAIDDIGAGQGGITTLTPEMILSVTEGSETIVADINETDDKVQIKLDESVKEFILPRELALADFEHEVSDDQTVIVIKPDVLDPDNAYDISLEIEGTGVHYGVAFVVFPYNGSECITTSWLTVNGATEECFAAMDSSGQVSLTIPYAMTPESEDTHIFVKRRI